MLIFSQTFSVLVTFKTSKFMAEETAIIIPADSMALLSVFEVTQSPMKDVICAK